MTGVLTVRGTVGRAIFTVPRVIFTVVFHRMVIRGRLLATSLLVLAKGDARSSWHPKLTPAAKAGFGVDSNAWAEAQAYLRCKCKSGPRRVGGGVPGIAKAEARFVVGGVARESQG